MGRTSSAVPADLHRYSRVGLDMDSALWHQASGLERVAERFESTCSEYRVPIRQHVDGMRRLYGWSFDLDFYAKRVAEGFERADQATALGMRSPQSVAVADGPLAEHARLLLLRLNLSRGTADYRQPITLVRRLRFMLWWRSLRPWWRAPIAFASVLFSGAMWPAQMVAWTGAGTWAEPLWPPRSVQGLWYVASVVGNAAKRLLATIWAGGRTPDIPSPIEPVETGFGRIIRETGREAGDGRVTEMPSAEPDDFPVGTPNAGVGLSVPQTPTGVGLTYGGYIGFGDIYAGGKYQGQRHPGCDIGGEAGTPVHPIGPGRVVVVRNDKTGYGHYVVVEHVLHSGDKVYSLYAHLDDVPSVVVGERVGPDTVLGGMGASGGGSGGTVHLHLEVRTSAGYQPFRPYKDADGADWGKYWLNPEEIVGNPSYAMQPLSDAS